MRKKVHRIVVKKAGGWEEYQLMVIFMEGLFSFSYERHVLTWADASPAVKGQ